MEWRSWPLVARRVEHSCGVLGDARLLLCVAEVMVVLSYLRAHEGVPLAEARSSEGRWPHVRSSRASKCRRTFACEALLGLRLRAVLLYRYDRLMGLSEGLQLPGVVAHVLMRAAGILVATMLPRAMLHAVAVVKSIHQWQGGDEELLPVVLVPLAGVLLVGVDRVLGILLLHGEVFPCTAWQTGRRPVLRRVGAYLGLDVELEAAVHELDRLVQVLELEAVLAPHGFASAVLLVYQLLRSHLPTWALEEATASAGALLVRLLLGSRVVRKRRLLRRGQVERLDLRHHARLRLNLVDGAHLLLGPLDVGHLHLELSQSVRVRARNLPHVRRDSVLHVLQRAQVSPRGRVVAPPEYVGTRGLPLNLHLSLLCQSTNVHHLALLLWELLNVLNVLHIVKLEPIEPVLRLLPFLTCSGLLCGRLWAVPNSELLLEFLLALRPDQALIVACSVIVELVDHQRLQHGCFTSVATLGSRRRLVVHACYMWGVPGVAREDVVVGQVEADRLLLVPQRLLEEALLVWMRARTCLLSLDRQGLLEVHELDLLGWWDKRQVTQVLIEALLGLDCH